MSKLTQAPRVELDVSVKLTIAEIKALDAIAGYGSKAFLEVFYEHMGVSYLRPHEAGLRSLFETIRSELSPIIERHKAARTAFALRDPIVMNRDEFHQRLALERSRASQSKEPR